MTASERRGRRPAKSTPGSTAAARRPRAPVRAEPEPAGAPDALGRLRVERDEPAEHLFRRLLGAYLGGAEEFDVVSAPGPTSTVTREVVASFCRRTYRPEVVSDEGSVLHIRDLEYRSPISLEERVHSMGRRVLEFHREAVASWSTLPLGDDTYWERRDDELDRDAWRIQRWAVLRSAVGSSLTPALGPWTIARSLERIADHAVVLGKVGGRLVDLAGATSPVTPLRQLHGQAMDHLAGALAVTECGAANDLLDVGDALFESGRSLGDRLLASRPGSPMPPATAAAVARILESIVRTVAYTQDIAQVVLDGPIVSRPDTAARAAPRAALAAAP